MQRIDAPWLTRPSIQAVVVALRDHAFFVGGAVRNTLLGAPVADIDIATPLTPEEVIEAAKAAGLRSVPTGLDHGTVTVIARGEPVEVTTFRADIETDGRHAKVRFTTRIDEDARRRDFTMNAIYAAPDGSIVDPLDGLPDLLARRVRFIGSPHDRIREDYLRILRFFRFHAWYGVPGDLDQDGLAASAELAEGIDLLARERIGAEIRKLLSAPDPAPAVAAMAASGILWRCLPGADPALLAPLIQREGEAHREPDWRLRLVALGAQDSVAALRLSNVEAKHLKAISTALAADENAAVTAYRHGAAAAWAAELLRAAASPEPLPTTIPALIAEGVAAVLPINANDLMATGLTPGPELGQALSSAEERWLASGFQLGKAELLERATP